MKGAIYLGALIPLLPVMLPAQAPSAAPPAAKAVLAEQRHKQHPEIAKVVDFAQSAPPEFSAHFLLQAAISTRLHDRVWQKEFWKRHLKVGISRESPYAAEPSEARICLT